MEDPRKSLLIVDDNEELRRLLERFLTMKGFAVTCASHGEEGLRKYLEAPKAYAAILLDIQMPGMNGCQVLRQIRANEDATDQRIQAIAMSGKVEVDDCPGFDAFLCKPFQFGEIVPLLHRLLKIGE